MAEWQRSLQHNITTAQELADRGLIPTEKINSLQKVIDKYPMNITPYYLDLIRENNDTDPIYKMCIASFQENDADGISDTSGESQNTIGSGIQHKYDNTVLLLSTNICAMYCRHCFRKRLVGVSEEETLNFVDDAIDYIKLHPEVDNVLITGGDAFLNSNRVIEKYLKQLSNIPHIRFIRFGTRTPVVFPQRITGDENLLAILKKYKFQKTIYVVTQFNHPREFTNQAREAIITLREHGIPVLNQTVLLSGINDNADTLASLFNQLVEVGVSPYYLFQCRPLKGVKSHFAIPLLRAVDIVDKTRAKLSGVAKRFRFSMSHIKGKIEILGKTKVDRIILKQHQARDNKDLNKFFTVSLDDNATWLPADFTYELL